MLRGWEQDETFKHQSEVNKRSRASEAPNGIGNYAGGSKPLVKYVAEYERKHGKRMSQEKLIHEGYKKKNGAWTSDRARIALENYKALCEKFKESHPEGITEEDAEKLWAEAVGGRKKGSTFCLGSLRSSGSDFRNPSTAQRSSNLNISQMEELRKTIEEQVRKNIEVEVQKSMEERMQQLLMKQRQEDAKVYQRMLDIQLSRYVLPPPQVDTSFQSLLNSSTPFYGSPSHPVGSLVAHQPTFMEQLHSSPPLLDSSALSTPRLSQVGTSFHPPAIGDNRLDGSGGQFSG